MGFNLAFKGLKYYSNIKDISSIKSWVFDLSGGEYGVKLGLFLFGNGGFFVLFSVVAQ